MGEAKANGHVDPELAKQQKKNDTEAEAKMEGWEKELKDFKKAGSKSKDEAAEQAKDLANAEKKELKKFKKAKAEAKKEQEDKEAKEKETRTKTPRKMKRTRVTLIK